MCNNTDIVIGPIENVQYILNWGQYLWNGMHKYSIVAMVKYHHGSDITHYMGRDFLFCASALAQYVIFARTYSKYILDIGIW